MKRFRALAAIGVMYAVLWFGFSIFDSFKLIDKSLVLLGIKKAHTERILQGDPADGDPAPPPPPPIKGDG
jgi:hypothetical protein